MLYAGRETARRLTISLKLHEIFTMSSAHIFYIPIILFVGAFAGFFLGRRAVEAENEARLRRRRRQQAAREQQSSAQAPSEKPSENTPE